MFDKKATLNSAFDKIYVEERLQGMTVFPFHNKSFDNLSGSIAKSPALFTSKRLFPE